VTAIQAVAQLWPARPDIKLVFPGTRHPNPSVADMPTAAGQARQLSDALGLTGRVVFFGDWIPYAEWPNVLAESDLALTLHFDTLETRLAFRSRLLDYLWAGLPVVATGGDATSELVAHFGVGIVVGFADVQGVAAAIRQLLAEPRAARQKDFALAQKELTWERAAAPLTAYCRNPWRAADRGLLARLPTFERVKKELEQASQERDHWRNLAEAYEQGRFMRFMKWLKRCYLIGKSVDR
jgi:glycosyltransferase involved in cell wall biosynthesis